MMGSTLKKAVQRLGIVAATSGAIAGVSLAASPVAQAATHISYVSSNCGGLSSCPDDALDLKYNSNLSGANFVWEGNNVDYAGYENTCGLDTCRTIYVFEAGTGGAANGAGQAVKNNAAGACTYSTTHAYYVYYNSFYMGHSQKFDNRGTSYGCSDFDSTLHNNNASQKEVS